MKNLSSYQKISLWVNILGTPILAIFISSLTYNFIPRWIYDRDFVFLETVLQSLYPSLIISVVIFVFLFHKERRGFKSTLYFVVLTTGLAILTSFLTLPFFVMLSYYLFS